MSIDVTRSVQIATVGGTASQPLAFSGVGPLPDNDADYKGHPAPRLVPARDILDLPATYDGPIFISNLQHTLRGEKNMGPDAEAFNARALVEGVSHLGVPIVYLSDGKSFVKDGRFLAPFPRSVMVSGQSSLLDRFRGNQNALPDLLDRLGTQYPKAKFFVLGDGSGSDARVCQNAVRTTAYIHNVDPSQSNIPAGFKGVVSDDYTPEFIGKVLGDITNAEAQSVSFLGHPHAPIRQVPASPNPPAMPRYTRLDKLIHTAQFTGTIAAGVGSRVADRIRRHFTDGSATLAVLQDPSTQLGQASAADLASMADRLIYDRHVDAHTTSAQLLRLITAHGTEPGSVDGIVTRTQDPEHFEKHLVGQDLATYRSLQATSQAVPGDWDGWQTYMDRATGSTAAPGTHMENFIDGEASFKAQYDAIDQARSFVNLSIHTFASDQAGWEYAKHLADAADRGCKVRVLYDKYGSATSMGQPTDPRLWQYLKRHGVECIEDQDSPLYEHVTHRKILATDDGSTGIVAFTGGVNIADYHRDYWHDVFSRVTGPGATDMSRLFLQQWQEEGGTVGDTEKARMLEPQTAFADGGVARIVSHDGLKDRNIKLAYLRAIDTATTSIDIADPYFTDKDVFAHLEAAARRGVQVRLFWPRKDNQKSTQYAAHQAYPSLLAAGVKIYEYAGLPMAHTKIAVFDGRLTTVGSSNLDARSLVNNDEANIWMDDPQVAADLTQRYFNKDIPMSYPVTTYHATGLEALKNHFYSALDSWI